MICSSKISCFFFLCLLQIFAICALYTTINFDVKVTIHDKATGSKDYTFDYPFKFGENVCNKTSGGPLGLSADVSSDARFFVITGVLSILYCIFIAAVYSVIDEIYTSKPEVPLAVRNLIQFFFIDSLQYF